MRFMGIAALLFGVAGMALAWFPESELLSLISSLLALGFGGVEAFRSKSLTLPVAAGIVLGLLALLFLAFFHWTSLESNEPVLSPPSETKGAVPSEVPQPVLPLPPQPTGTTGTTIPAAPVTPAVPAGQSGAGGVPTSLPESGIAPALPSSSSEPSPALPPLVSAPPSTAASPPGREEVPVNTYSLPAEMLPANATSLPAEMKPANATSLPAEMKPANATSLPATLVPR